MIREPRQRGHRRDSMSQNSRSQGVSRGRWVPDRRRIQTWCSRARCSKTRSQHSRCLPRHPRSHARNVRIELPVPHIRSQTSINSPDQVLRNHRDRLPQRHRFPAIFPLIWRVRGGSGMERRLAAILAADVVGWGAKRTCPRHGPDFRL